MTRAGLAAMLVLLTAACAAHAAWAKPCPALIGLSRSGGLYDSRGGAWVRQSASVLGDVLANGCYPDGAPAPTSSVTLYIEKGASSANVLRVYKLLEGVGWPKGKVDTKNWTNAPRAPRETR